MVEMRRRAVFFSIVSVFLVLLFVAFTQLSESSVAQETELELTRRRVNLANTIIEDMEDTYFEKIIYVSAKNSIIGLSEYYSETGFSTSRLQKFLEFALQDVIYNATLKDSSGNDVDLSAYIDRNYTIDNLLDRVSESFEDLGLEVEEFEIEIKRDSMRQIDPWTIELEADITYDLRDTSGIASWKGTTTKTVEIPVYGFYAFDYENGKSNIGVITDSWIMDTSPYTEPSVLNKLSRHSSDPDSGLGICSPDFNNGGETCANDTAE